MQSRSVVVTAATLAIVVAASAQGAAETPLLSAQGIAATRFGTTKPRALRQLSSLLGRPTRRFVSDGCGPKYTEVEWGHLYAEFRQGRLSGFRYMRGPWLPSRAAPGSGSSPVRPRAATNTGITLGSTLRDLRQSSHELRLVGTDRWQSRDGLVFYLSFAVTQPPPPSSRITEIKYGTCGDW